MKYLVFIPFVLQSICMIVDEFHFHRIRGLGRWERLGHPMDTLSVMVFYGYLILVAPSASAILIAALIGIGSCALITKDEFVHTRECSAGENWLHAVLFILHPLVLISALIFWPMKHYATLPIEWMWLEPWRSFESVLTFFFGLSGLMFFHQVLFWNFLPAFGFFGRRGQT